MRASEEIMRQEEGEAGRDRGKARLRQGFGGQRRPAMWLRMRSTMAGSVMTETTRSSTRHRGQRRGSTSRTFLRRRAQEALRALSSGDWGVEEGVTWPPFAPPISQERTRFA